MQWQELTVLAISLAAAVYAVRVFLRQFDIGKKPEQEHCAQCGPGEKTGRKTVRILSRKSS